MKTLAASSKLPWVIFVLEQQRYAVSCEFAREMTTFSDHVAVPESPEHVRGLINLRGKVIPLLDLRVWLGFASAKDDTEKLVQTLAQREQDHRDWLDALEDSVMNNRPFTKATDPHKCAFGKWYDSYTTENITIRSLLRQFDAPHKAIHAIAAQALAAAERGEHEAAHRIVAETRDTKLRQMVSLFGALQEALRLAVCETALVLERNGNLCAVAVDTVESVEPLSEIFDSTAVMYQDGCSSRLPWIGRRQKDDSPVLLPDIDSIFAEV